jgi:3-oxoacyl-[acyl-carrier protein] reductase
MDKIRNELEGRVALITGASRGIGKAIAACLAKAGAKTVIADINLSSANKMRGKKGARHGNSITCAVDVTDGNSVNSMVQTTLDRFGRVDILVNNAGIMFRTRFLNISREEWEKTLQVNLTGPFLCTQAVIPAMKTHRYGRIVNVSSSAGRSVSTLGGAHYTASKAGLLGLTRATAKEVAPLGITVNAVCPGLIDTQMARLTTTEAELTAFINSFPIRRLGLPREIGDLVVFLCSEKAAYITGTSIDINGGDLMI